jgi:hypothetical protein
MTDVHLPLRRCPALLEFAAAFGSASAALRRDDNDDWRIKGKLGFIYAIPGTLEEPGREGLKRTTETARPSLDSLDVKSTRERTQTC